MLCSGLASKADLNSVTLLSLMDGNDLPSGVGMSSLSSLVHINSYCRLKYPPCPLGHHVCFYRLFLF